MANVKLALKIIFEPKYILNREGLFGYKYSFGKISYYETELGDSCGLESRKFLFSLNPTFVKPIT